MNYIEFSLILYFFLHVYNKTLVGDCIKAKLEPFLHEKINYILSCSLCFPFWITLMILPIAAYNWTFIFIVPTLTHFIDRFYEFITKPA